jgi:hypothetical protein
MARSFNGTSDYIEHAAPLLTAAPITLACWFNATDATTSMTLVSISDIAGITNYFRLGLNSPTAGRVGANARSAVNATAESSASYVANTWNHGCAVFASASSRSAYLNGAAAGSDATASTPAGLDATNIGCLRRTTRITFLSGAIAEVGIWNSALSAADVAALAKGFSPTKVRPDALVFYSPLIREVRDLRAGVALTTNGTTVAAHPRVYGL